MDEYIKKINLDLITGQTLAFIGDAVFDLYIRTYLASKSNKQTGLLHKEATHYVSAKAQSKIIDTLEESLSEEEIDIYKRGRNTNIQTVKKSVDVVEYKKATGFEALLGRLYIDKKIERLEEIISKSIKIIEGE